MEMIRRYIPISYFSRVCVIWVGVVLWYNLVEILDYSREYCKYILSSLQSNNGYDKIKKDTLSFLKALVEYLKDKKKGFVTKEVEKLILQFAEDDIKRKMRGICRKLSKPYGLNKLVVCPRNHVNIGNVLTCSHESCNKKLIIECGGSHQDQHGVCPHSNCKYADGCCLIEILPLHQSLVDLFLSTTREQSGFFTRTEHADLLIADNRMGAISVESSINNHSGLVALGETELITLFDLERPSPMDIKLERAFELDLPDYASISM